MKLRPGLTRRQHLAATGAVALARPRDPLSVEFLQYQKELLRHLGQDGAKT